MTRVVVIGGGFGGMAAAARLAKLGHEVTLLERAAHLGGALTTEELDGFAWDAGPTHDAPAGGHPRPVPQVRAARWSARSTCSRSTVRARAPVRRRHRRCGSPAVPGPPSSTAFDELGPGLGQQWVDHVDVLRRCVGAAAQGVVRAALRRRRRTTRAHRPAQRAASHCTRGCGDCSRTSGCGWSPATAR